MSIKETIINIVSKIGRCLDIFMLRITLVFLFSITGFSQNYQTVEEVDNICSQLGFASDEEAQIAVDKILNEMGIPSKSFKLRSCPNINNAIAKNIKDANGNYERYILYDINFMKRISDNAQNDWSAISVLAHEIGHHLSGHSLNNKGSNHKWELEADYFSGVSLAKMGASLEESQSAIQTLRYEKETSTHPAKADRLIEIEKGWIAGGGNNSLNSENVVSSEEFNLFGNPIFEKAKENYNKVKVPMSSPRFSYTKEIGGTYFSLNYSRPSIKERTIFGEVIPYNALWRTGANENTTISFTQDIYIDGKLLKKGTYALYTTPNTSSWTVYFYSDYDNWGTPENWDSKKIKLSIEVPKITLSDTQESFSILLEATGKNTGELILMWENTKIKVAFETATSANNLTTNTKEIQQVGLTQIQLEYNNVITDIDKSYTKLVETITFDDDISLCDKNIKAGTYKILGKRDKDGSLSVQLEQKNRKIGSKEVTGTSIIDICRIPALRTDRAESTYYVNVNDLTDLEATLNFYIDSKKYKFQFKLPTDEKVFAVINAIEEIGAATSGDYLAFAIYYLNKDLDINIAKKYIDKADAMNPDKFWILNQKSIIYYKIGDKKEAINIAKRALEGAKAANNSDYVSIIGVNLAEWQ